MSSDKDTKDVIVNSETENSETINKVYTFDEVKVKLAKQYLKFLKYIGKTIKKLKLEFRKTFSKLC